MSEETTGAVPFPRRPWLTIWTRPRETIRAIIESDPRRHFLLLAALASVCGGMPRLILSGTHFQVAYELSWAVVGGIAGFFLLGWIIEWIGSRQDADGLPEEIRAALAWSSVPGIALGPLWFLQMWFFGGSTPDNQFAIELPAFLLWTDVALSLLATAASYAIAVRALAEVQGFSIVRAIANLAISTMPFVVAYIAFSRFDG